MATPSWPGGPFRRWCKFRGFCPATGYKMLREGRGPKTFMTSADGGRRNVTPEADEEWRLDREAEAQAKEATPV